MRANGSDGLVWKFRAADPLIPEINRSVSIKFSRLVVLGLAPQRDGKFRQRTGDLTVFTPLHVRNRCLN
jgi:hypothetical protein